MPWRGVSGGTDWGRARPEADDDDDGDSKMPIECRAALSVEAAEKNIVGREAKRDRVRER